MKTEEIHTYNKEKLQDEISRLYYTLEHLYQLIQCCEPLDAIELMEEKLEIELDL